jgi:hypothetical protein
VTNEVDRTRGAQHTACERPMAEPAAGKRPPNRGAPGMSRFGSRFDKRARP